MQRSLELMNIKLANVIDQIQGASGLKVIRAILGGERDAEALLSLCHASIRRNKGEDVKKALEGNYNPTYLKMLQSSMDMWESFQLQIRKMEEEIEQLQDRINEDTSSIEVTSKSRPTRHHQPAIKDLHTSRAGG